MKEMTPTKRRQVIEGTVASVSNPSVKFTPFANTAIDMVIKGIKSQKGR